MDEGGKLTLVSSLAWHWMAIDREGKFAGAPDEFGEWFARVTPKGRKPALIACSDFPCVVGRDGNLYYAHMHGLKVVRRTPEGKETVLIEPEKFGVEVKRPYGVNGMACGPDGAIYLILLDSLNRNEGTGEHILFAVGMDGSVKELSRNFVKENLAEDQRHHDVRPEYCRGMAVNENGDVYVAVTGSRCVMKYTAKEKAWGVVARCEKPWTPTGVEVFKGEVYVLEYDDETPVEGREWRPRVRKVGRDGKVVEVARRERKK